MKCFSMNDFSEAEEWRPVVGFPNYEVSNIGGVRSWTHKNGRRRTPKIRALGFGHVGHRNVTLRVSGRTYLRSVHRMVLEAFIGPCPPDMECRHIDGNPGNNRLDNLAWGTRSENALDRRRHGTQQLGESNCLSRLTTSQVVEIKKKLARRESKCAIAKEFGVRWQAIKRIAIGQTWKHVQPTPDGQR